MQTAKTENERPRDTKLVEQYRAIGPAAILAALLHSRKPEPAAVEKAA